MILPAVVNAELTGEYVPEKLSADWIGATELIYSDVGRSVNFCELTAETAVKHALLLTVCPRMPGERGIGTCTA